MTYYDFRRDTTDPNVLLTDYWQIVSHNGGNTWAESHVTGPFDMRTAPNVRGFFVGDYEAFADVDGSLLPFFVVANSGNLNNRTDVFAALQRAGAEESGNQRDTAQEQVNTAARSSQVLAASHRESRRANSQ